MTLIVLDSLGIGAAPDAARYEDEGSATLQHIAEAVGGLDLPHLSRLGLGRIAPCPGIEPDPDPQGAFGVMQERSPGKDTTTGHWEIAGVLLDKPFPTYPHGFPPEVIEPFERAVGRKVLGNRPASGTEIIEELGGEHMATGRPIVYTSADSVFQIAAHVDTVPVEQLYDWCRVARSILSGPHEVGRVIARPFGGRPGAFERTPDRHDFSVTPPAVTVLDEICNAGLEVRGVGKIADIFGGRGVTSSRPTGSNAEGIEATIEETRSIARGLVFTNLVDFDQAFGHRNDPHGYARALKELDSAVPDLLAALKDDQVLFFTADHGNDPTTPSTDHSRELVPVLAAGRAIARGADAGERSSFADLGATVAELVGVHTATPGRSFAREILGRP